MICMFFPSGSAHCLGETECSHTSGFSDEFYIFNSILFKVPTLGVASLVRLTRL